MCWLCAYRSRQFAEEQAEVADEASAAAQETIRHHDGSTAVASDTRSGARIDLSGRPADRRSRISEKLRQ